MKLEIVDVGPRDGLQNEDGILSPAEIRAELCDRLAAPLGLRESKTASFVNPKLVPQMAGAEEVMQKLGRRPNTTYAGLVLNERGYERAVEAGVDEVRYAFPVTDTFAKKNQNTTVVRCDGTGIPARRAGAARRGALFGHALRRLRMPVRGMGRAGSRSRHSGPDRQRCAG